MHSLLVEKQKVSQTLLCVIRKLYCNDMYFSIIIWLYNHQIDLI